MSATGNARRLRCAMTDEEKQLWQALRAGRFAGFKFRRQHPWGKYYLDFFCPVARLAVELDGFHHGLPEQRSHDAEREAFITAKGIVVLRFWNRQWQANRAGILLEIWRALHERAGCVEVVRKIHNRRFLPPAPDQFVDPKAG